MAEHLPVTGRAVDRRIARLAVALAFVGGYVDAVGFVALAHVFTGHVTGNTVMLAIDVAEGEWAGIPQRLLAIAMFIAGIVLGAVLNERIVRRAVRSRFTPVFVLEAILLAPLMLSGGAFAHDTAQAPLASAWPLYALTALTATALGLQNGTLRRVGSWVAHTTYISGAVTALTEGVLERWFQRRDRKPAGPSVSAAVGTAADSDAAAHARLLILASIVSSFAAGALVGVALYVSRGLETLVVPLALLLIMAAIDAKRPLVSRPGSSLRTENAGAPAAQGGTTKDEQR